MIQIFATDKEGNRKEVKDLYWFEEEGVHNFEGEGHFREKYNLEVFVDGKQVYPTADLSTGQPHQDCYYHSGCGCGNVRLGVEPRR